MEIFILNQENRSLSKELSKISWEVIKDYRDAGKILDWLGIYESQRKKLLPKIDATPDVPCDYFYLLENRKIIL